MRLLLRAQNENSPVLLIHALLLAAASPPERWMLLGSAPTGQSVTVDAASLEVAGDRRRAWFRLFTAAELGRDVPAYRLEIDCEAEMINALAVRHYAADGTRREQDFGPAGEGAAPVEAGTATGIAHQALCGLELYRIMEHGGSGPRD
jgi:hypothetical protein